MISYASQGHESQLYFNGQVSEGDPGALFYPITFLWRTTPVVLIGLGLSLFGLSFPKAKLLPSAQRRPLVMLLLFASLFTVFMTFGAKKFDRYLLPVFPPIDLVAGIGWVAAIGWIQQPRRWVQVAMPAIMLIALAGQMIALDSGYPYYFSYYNPLLGGLAKAPDVMMVGWGEGLDQAAQFLNDQHGAAEQQVATGIWPTTFSYYYQGRVVSSRFEPGPGAVEAWVESDYYLLYINEKQRQKISTDLSRYLDHLHPAHVIRVDGLDYVYIYDIGDLPLPDFLKPASGYQAGQ
jgi:4-amino-4-deoxy-L-arabinose transferase-like glycosyltransferase